MVIQTGERGDLPSVVLSTHLLLGALLMATLGMRSWPGAFAGELIVTTLVLGSMVHQRLNPLANDMLLKFLVLSTTQQEMGCGKMELRCQALLSRHGNL